MLYTGITSNLPGRVRQHRLGLLDGYTRKYNIHWLAYYEETSDVEAAITREKQVKRWRREKKMALVESMNPAWRDLSDGWYSDDELLVGG